MRRRLSRLLTIASTLLLGGVIAMWVRSYSWVDYAYFNEGVWPASRSLGATACRGAVRFDDISNRPMYGVESTLWTQGYYGRWDWGRADIRNTDFYIGILPFTQEGHYPTVFEMPAPSFAGFQFGKESRQRSGMWDSGQPPPRITYRFLTLPFWSLAVLLSALPTWSVIGLLRSRWHKNPGCCRRCEYDLRATRERCPECGTRIVGSVRAIAP